MLTLVYARKIDTESPVWLLERRWHWIKIGFRIATNSARCYLWTAEPLAAYYACHFCISALSVDLLINDSVDNNITQINIHFVIILLQFLNKDPQ